MFVVGFYYYYKYYYNVRHVRQHGDHVCGLTCATGSHWNLCGSSS